MSQPLYYGVEISRSEMAPPGVIVGIDLGKLGVGAGVTYYADFLTLWRLTHNGRDPFLSRYCAGVRELNRNRRRR